MSGGWSVAQAVGVVTEMRSSLGDPEPCQAVERFLGGVVLALKKFLYHGLADRFVGPLGIGLGLRELDESCVVVGSIQVSAVLPNIPGHVVEAVAVRREGFYGRGTREAVLGGVIVGEFTLEDVGLPFPPGLRLVSPHEKLVIKASPGSPFPFDFGGESFSGPFAISKRVLVGDADNGMIHSVLDA